MSNKEWWFNQKWYSEKEVIYLKNWEYEKQNEILPEFIQERQSYTLLQLASMSFEQWDYLIERENLTNNA